MHPTRRTVRRSLMWCTPRTVSAPRAGHWGQIQRAEAYDGSGRGASQAAIPLVTHRAPVDRLTFSGGHGAALVSRKLGHDLVTDCAGSARTGRPRRRPPLRKVPAHMRSIGLTNTSHDDSSGSSNPTPGTVRPSSACTHAGRPQNRAPERCTDFVRFVHFARVPTCLEVSCLRPSMPMRTRPLSQEVVRSCFRAVRIRKPSRCPRRHWRCWPPAEVGSRAPLPGGRRRPGASEPWPT